MTGTPEPPDTNGAPRDILVLVVDDSPMDRQLAGGLIRKALGARIAFAGNGREAFESMQRDLPDIVVTDLQMPEMDGLELVQLVREKYPFVPTLLMTAHGSDEIALAALQKGAASYVAKRSLSVRLAETVNDVLALSGGGRSQRRLFSCWQETTFEFLLENDALLIPPLVAHLQQYASSIRPMDETEQLRVGVALHEALRNAMHHGNLELSSALRSVSSDSYYEEAERRRKAEPYASRKVKFVVKEGPAESKFVITDEGPGFDLSQVQYDPTDPKNLERPSGRGLFLIRMFMDEVSFNYKGNEITMIHRRSA